MVNPLTEPPSIRIGPAGSDGRGYPKALAEIARLGLDCMEVAFTYGVRMKPEMAAAVGEQAAAHGIALSVHAPYYINLAAYEEEKIVASRQRILDSCHRAHLMGARCVVFHAGFYQKRSARETYRLIRDQILTLQAEIRRAGWDIDLCPEITGKPSQFGSARELLALMADTGCGLTVDFAHLLARQQGQIAYDALMPALPDNLHAHFSGIEYTAKGEKKHLRLQPDDFRPLLEALRRHRKQATIICESPAPFEDAVMMKNMVDKEIPTDSGP
ncbi:MAG: TIM barrel protein [Desulfobacterales bacterium]|nr:TIM barrel protein [Desulfobacterales bacterium]